MSNGVRALSIKADNNNINNNNAGDGDKQNIVSRWQD